MLLSKIRQDRVLGGPAGQMLADSTGNLRSCPRAAHSGLLIVVVSAIAGWFSHVATFYNV